jgi:hypothetical protein
MAHRCVTHAEKKESESDGEIGPGNSGSITEHYRYGNCARHANKW